MELKPVCAYWIIHGYSSELILIPAGWLQVCLAAPGRFLSGDRSTVHLQNLEQAATRYRTRVGWPVVVALRSSSGRSRVLHHTIDAITGSVEVHSLLRSACYGLNDARLLPV